MEIQKDRPPFVRFEARPEEDRERTLSEGVYTSKDVIYAIITPAGSKDCVERRAEEWFKQLDQQVREERFPLEWLRHYREAFKAWSEDRILPDEGHAIMNWPVASPAQVKTLLDLRIRTVEDLAVANEETIGRLGMGGRALKQRAQDWLSSVAHGKNSGELERLRQENETLRQRNESLEASNRELAALVEKYGATPMAQKL